MVVVPWLYFEDTAGLHRVGTVTSQKQRMKEDIELLCIAFIMIWKTSGSANH